MIRDRFKTQRGIPPLSDPSLAGWNPYNFESMKPLHIQPDTATIGIVPTRYAFVVIPPNSWAIGKFIYLEQRLQLVSGPTAPGPATTCTESFGMNSAVGFPVTAGPNLPAPGCSSIKWFRRLLLRQSNSIVIADYHSFQNEPNAAYFDNKFNEFSFSLAGYPVDFTTQQTFDFSMTVAGGGALVTCTQLFAQAFIQAPYFLGRVR